MKKLLIVSLCAAVVLILDNLFGYGPISYTSAVILFNVLCISYDTVSLKNKSGENNADNL